MWSVNALKLYLVYCKCLMMKWAPLTRTITFWPITRYEQMPRTAFDTIDHDILSFRLQHRFGIPRGLQHLWMQRVCVYDSVCVCNVAVGRTARGNKTSSVVPLENSERFDKKKQNKNKAVIINNHATMKLFLSTSRIARCRQTCPIVYLQVKNIKPPQKANMPQLISSASLSFHIRNVKQKCQIIVRSLENNVVLMTIATCGRFITWSYICYVSIAPARYGVRLPGFVTMGTHIFNIAEFFRQIFLFT